MTTEMTPAQAEAWARFRAETGEAAPAPRFVDAFGADEAMQDALLALVLSGGKRATATLARWFADDPDGPPKPGDLVLVTDGRGAPACVIRTVSVDIRPVSAVDEAFAAAEGEGDGSLAAWLDGHRAFWRREAAEAGFTYSDALEVVCERFAVVWRADGGAV